MKIFFFVVDLVAHHSSVVAKPWSESNNYLVMPSSMGGIVPPQYSAPPPPIQYATSPMCASMMQLQAPMPTGSNCSSTQNIPETHKSMWAINPLYASNSGKFKSYFHYNDLCEWLAMSEDRNRYRCS